MTELTALTALQQTRIQMPADGMEVQTVPLTAVPILLQILASPEHPNRDETLTLLCDLVASSYGEDGDALGATLREAGGLLTLSWLLAEPEPEIQKQTLFLIANLASDAVDPRSYLTKRLLRQCGCEFRLLPCLDAEDPEVVTYPAPHSRISARPRVVAGPPRRGRRLAARGAGGGRERARAALRGGRAEKPDGRAGRGGLRRDEGGSDRQRRRHEQSAGACQVGGRPAHLRALRGALHPTPMGQAAASANRARARAARARGVDAHPAGGGGAEGARGSRDRRQAEELIRAEEEERTRVAAEAARREAERVTAEKEAARQAARQAAMEKAMQEAAAQAAIDAGLLEDEAAELAAEAAQKAIVAGESLRRPASRCVSPHV